jgi:hypothetical protein
MAAPVLPAALPVQSYGAFLAALPELTSPKTLARPASRSLFDQSVLLRI